MFLSLSTLRNLVLAIATGLFMASNCFANGGVAKPTNPTSKSSNRLNLTNISAEPATATPDIHKSLPTRPSLNPKEFFDYVSGLYGDTLSEHAQMHDRLASSLDEAIATDTFEAWAEISDKLDQAERVLNRCQQHLSTAAAPNSIKSVLLEASRAYAHLSIGRDCLESAQRDMDFLDEMIELGLEIGI